MQHNFNEKEKELGLPVYQLPKFHESKKKAIEMIESGKYCLNDGDFWILMNKSKNGDKMLYSGLIISHKGCQKINDNLDSALKFKGQCVHVDKEGYGETLVVYYVDDDIYEVGEVSKKNCKNDYPYAMALKRCFDRVVLLKSKLAFSGIYSESEADEFSEPTETVTVSDEEINKAREVMFVNSATNKWSGLRQSQIDWALQKFNVKSLEELTPEQEQLFITALENAKKKEVK